MFESIAQRKSKTKSMAWWRARFASSRQKFQQAAAAASCLFPTPGAGLCPAGSAGREPRIQLLPGFARGEAEVVLTPEGDGTVLSYTAKANVGGKLAQIGQRLIDGAAKQIADDFFSRFAATVGAPAAPADAQQSATHDDSHPVPQVAHTASAPAPGRPTSRREGVAPEIWVVGLIAIIVILVVIFSALLP